MTLMINAMYDIGPCRRKVFPTDLLDLIRVPPETISEALRCHSKKGLHLPSIRLSGKNRQGNNLGHQTVFRTDWQPNWHHRQQHGYRNHTAVGFRNDSISALGTQSSHWGKIFTVNTDIMEMFMGYFSHH